MPIPTTNLHIGQLAMTRSRARTTLVTAGQGGGKTSGAYEWVHGLIDEYPGESGLIGFPDYGLLTRVVLDVSDPERQTLLQFLESIGQKPVLHIQRGFIECKDAKIFFVSGNHLVGFEGSHCKWAWIDEFDECPVGAYKRAMERTRMASGHVLLTGTPRNVRWCKQEITSKIGAMPQDMGNGLRVAVGNKILWLQFPSIFNPKYSQEQMEEARGMMPDWEYRRVHLGELAEMEGGNAFKREWWRRYSELPELEQIIQVWDTAFKAKTHNDYSVCATWGKAKGKPELYLLDLLRKKMEWPELLKTSQDMYRSWKPGSVRVEDKASGQSLIQELRTKGIPVVAVKADIDKWRRATAVTGLVEAGYVYLPDYTPWVGDFIEEHAQFSPDDTHDYDDQVDTTSMALGYFKASILAGGQPRIISESKVSTWTGKGAGGKQPVKEESTSRIISGKGKSRFR